MHDGRYITTEEILEVKKDVLEFLHRVLKGEGSPAEVEALPEVLKILPSFY